MRRAPWWVLLSAGGAPVLLVGGWTIAQLLQGPAYDPVGDTLSVLASHGARGYWLMTGMLIVLGACYVITAHGLREAATAGRAALAGGGLCAMALTLVPAPLRGGSFGHGVVAASGFVLLAVWPALAASRGRKTVPWALRFNVSILATSLMCANAVWFVVELQSGQAPGVAERVLTFVQALWPLVVAASCRLWPPRPAEATS
ncbi:hypothetical protein EES43_28670 [Streptomyces sp. ADI96-02]|uniref:DUF998 domain-containing protein n=1 Tax=unclassified Streptomyces TaxID=2593676 RepID=UPI000F54F75F|nr:DUF998 domain-containing protein [Streptomyces sp. ADI96-02]RPK54550.1 hypothetical protein EES43_28670 [Streptomyces sp. ADI96-02]